jgi:hypothetical protein
MGLKQASLINLGDQRGSGGTTCDTGPGRNAPWKQRPANAHARYRLADRRWAPRRSAVPSRRIERPFSRFAPPPRVRVARSIRRRREEKKSRKFRFVPRGVHDNVARLQGPAGGGEGVDREAYPCRPGGQSVQRAALGKWRVAKVAVDGSRPILRGMTLPKGPSLICIQRHCAAGPVVANRQLQGPPW